MIIQENNLKVAAFPAFCENFTDWKIQDFRRILSINFCYFMEEQWNNLDC